MRINDNPTASGSGLGAGPTGAGGDKSMPKDGRVMMAILKDMNITDYEPRVVEQLLEFTYRYISSVLEDARTLANFAKKKGPPGAAGSSGGGNQAGAGAVQIDVEDVKLAVQMYAEHNLTSPPTRDILLEVASKKNSTQLPLPKATGGLRLPPDRYCLTAVNYKLKPLKGGSGSGQGKRGPGKKTLASSQAATVGFTMRPQLPGTSGGPAASIKINPLPTGGVGGASTAPKFQIQAAPGALAGSAPGQPMFSMTVNPAALAGAAPRPPAPGTKRSADQMEKS